MEPITLALTHYNRFELLLECIALVQQDARISEIVISDDASTDGSFEKLLKHFKDVPKVKLFRNEQNLDCYANKAKAVERSTNKWVILFDSDNVLSPDYLNALCKLPLWDPATVYCPAAASPHFNYSEHAGKLVSHKNVAVLMGRRNSSFRTALNTCNYFVHRDEYLSVWDGTVNPHTADTIYQAYNWFKKGNKLLIVPGLSYFHRIHPQSHYKLNHKKTGNFHNEVEGKLLALT